MKKVILSTDSSVTDIDNVITSNMYAYQSACGAIYFLILDGEVTFFEKLQCPMNHYRSYISSSTSSSDVGLVVHNIMKRSIRMALNDRRDVFEFTSQKSFFKWCNEVA